MRSSIRNQILLPFCLVQAVAIVVISGSSAWLAVQRAERDAVARLDRVVVTLSSAQFPVRDSILAQMKGLSDADFIAAAEQDRITATTLDRDVAERLLASYPDSLPISTELGQLQPLNTADQRWLVGGIALPRSPELKLLLVLIPEQNWLAVRRDVVLPPLVTGTLALMATALMSWWIASRFGTRVQRMQQHVQELAGGQLDQRLPVAGDDEFGQLAESINRMAVDLQALTERLRIADRAELVTQVAGGLAHQLRNSITGAKLAIQLHARRHPDGNHESLNVAVQQMTLMESQIRGLLGLTKDAREPVRSGQLDDIVRRVCELLRPRCGHAQVELRLQISSSLPGENLEVLDAEQMEAAVMNLVTNAIEACGSSGRVDVALSENDGGAQLTVLDTGPGVPENLRVRMFEPFVTGKPEGIGLGLAIARRAAETIGGRLEYDRHEGQSRFRMWMPKSE